MTRTALADELWPLLNDEPQKKQGAVYVSLQVRNSLKDEGKPAQCQVLRFFCDWVAHLQPQGTGARDLLNMLDGQLPAFGSKRIYRKMGRSSPQ
jgi:hypothetical protein